MQAYGMKAFSKGKKISVCRNCGQKENFRAIDEFGFSFAQSLAIRRLPQCAAVAELVDAQR
jgi:hypothetical protein